MVIKRSKRHEVVQPVLSAKHDKIEVESFRKSVLESLKENFRVCGRLAYVHRMIYVGEHARENVNIRLKADIEKSVNILNDNCDDEKLTGFLFHHMRYFCHFVEGSEETLVKHLQMLFGNENIRNQLGRMKLLVVYHHVNQRILDEWMLVTAKPATLLEKIDMAANMEQTMEKVKYCVEKLYGLGMTLRPINILIEDQMFLPPEQQERSESKVKNIFGQVVNPIYPYLPELAILEFLLTTNNTRDLRTYLELYGDVPCIASYEDLVWPIPWEVMPKNFLEQQDPKPVRSLLIQSLQ